MIAETILVAVLVAWTAFASYWIATDRAERRARARQSHLLDELDAAARTIAGQVAYLESLTRHPSRRHLHSVGGAS